MVEAVRSLGPTILAAADDIEANRRLPASLVAALDDAGAYAMYVPASVGGAEVHPLTAMLVTEELARHDPSTGWCVQVSAAVTSFLAWIDPTGLAQLVDAVPAVRLAGSARPLGTAREVEGGFEVSGHWNYVSGVRDATLVLASAVLEPRQGDPPLARSMFLPVTDGTVVANWDVMGMCGTGSDDFVLDGVFVPDERVGYKRWIDQRDEPLYDPRLAMVAAWAPTVGVACGTARGAIEELVALGGNSTTMSTDALRDRPAVQDAIGEAQALAASARAFVVDAIGAAWDALELGAGDLGRRTAEAQLAITHALRTAVTVADLCFHAAGTSAISTGYRLQRFLRDAHTAVQHAAGHRDHFRTGGRSVLGLDAGAMNLRVGDRPGAR